MKTIFTILLVSMASVVFSSKYEETMKTNIDNLSLILDGDKFKNTANVSP